MTREVPGGVEIVADPPAVDPPLMVDHVVPPSMGDEADQGVTELYRSHYRPMVGLAGLLLGSPQAGEDVVQDAFARLLLRWSGIDDPVGYLRAAVVNASRSRIRRALVARRHPPVLPPAAPGPEERTEALATRMALRESLGRLSPRQREAVVLRYYAGLSDTQVAEAMGVSVGSVKSHLHRAMASLADELEDLR